MDIQKEFLLWVGAALVCAMVVSFIMCPLVKSFAYKIGAIDVPKDSRRMHKKPVPRLGGLAIFLGFMPYNKNPAKMFMGDTGSTFLGYILATYSIQGLFKYYAIVSFAVPFLVLGLPIFDTAFAIVRRVARGQSPMTPDRGHIHHRMMDMGLNQKQTVAALYVVSSLLGLSAVVLTTSGELKAMLLLLTLAAVAYVASRVIFPREIAETAHEKELEQEEMQAKSAAPAPEEKEEKHEEN